MVISGYGIREAFLREEEVAFGLYHGPGWVSAPSIGREGVGCENSQAKA